MLGAHYVHCTYSMTLNKYSIFVKYLEIKMEFVSWGNETGAPAKHQTEQHRPSSDRPTDPPNKSVWAQRNRYAFVMDFSLFFLIRFVSCCCCCFSLSSNSIQFVFMSLKTPDKNHYTQFLLKSFFLRLCVYCVCGDNVYGS